MQRPCPSRTRPLSSCFCICLLLRLLFLLNSPPMFLYNLIAGAWSGAAIETVAFCSFALAVWRFDLRPAARAER